MTLQFCRSAGALLLVAAVMPACSGSSPASPTSPSAASPVAAPAPEPAPAPVPAPVRPRSPAETYSTTTVSFTSDHDHHVGRGRSITLTPQNATFDVQMWPNQGTLFVEIRLKDSTPLSFWLLKVMSPNGGATRIAPGTFETTRELSSPAWFFDVGSDARGCTATARLVIHAFELAPGTTTLQTFRASFENHHCNGSPPSMRGEIAILNPWK